MAKFDIHQLGEGTKYIKARLKGEGVHSSLTMHQLAATGYYGEGNKENRPMPNSSSRDVKTSKVPIEMQNHYFEKL